MTKPKKGSDYYVRCRFLSLTDEQVGMAQHYMIDEGWPVARAAAKFKVSEATMYRVRAAVPAHLVVVSKKQRQHQRWLRDRMAA